MEAASMSRTLNLAKRTLALGRNLHKLGCDGEAIRLLGQLAGWRQLPGELAEETQSRLGEIRLRYHQYAQARRHLAAALLHRPDNAQGHFRLAAAFAADEEDHAQAAYQHYKRSLQLDPNQPDCLGDFGLLALKLGKEEEGLWALRRAVELAPDDPEIVAKLSDGLCQCGQVEEARLTLRAALFRNSRSYAFHKLWNNFRFQRAQEAQQAARQFGPGSSESDEPVLLPFVPGGGAETPPPHPRRRLRLDRTSPLSPPHTPRQARVPDRKHA
jgi:tetratricopeptide (TPR) repeat protein